MELDNIEKLLEKYLEATTTVAEEETLRNYFSQDSVATHLEQYSPMFQYFSKAKEERYTKQLPLAPTVVSSRRNYFKWASVAAVVLLFGMYFGKSYMVEQTNTLEEEYTQEEIAQAQEAFKLLAFNFNKGAEQLSHLNEFEKNTNKFLIKEEKQ
jgi:hypothetical protein